MTGALTQRVDAAKTTSPQTGEITGDHPPEKRLSNRVYPARHNADCPQHRPMRSVLHAFDTYEEEV